MKKGWLNAFTTTTKPILLSTLYNYVHPNDMSDYLFLFLFLFTYFLFQ